VSGDRIIDPACGGGAFLIAAFRRGVSANRLYGIDIDPTAVAVCRLGLALAGARDPHILCADALHLEAAGVTQPYAPAPLGPSRGVRQPESVRHPDDAGFPAGFGAVVGNPPWGQKGLRFPPAEAAWLRRRFAVARGVLDPFKLFVERAHELCRPDGRWAMVLPDIILLKNQRPVRDLILAGSAIEWIVHAGRAFPGVNLDAVIIVARRTPDRPSPRHRVAIWHTLPPDWRHTPPETKTTAQAVFGELDDHRFNLYLDEAGIGLLRRLGQLPRLGDRYEVHEGVHSGNRRAQLFLDHPRGDSCAPLIVRGDEVLPFAIKWAGRWLDRDCSVIDRARGGYANLGQPEWHLSDKILVRRTGDRVIAARERGGRFASNNFFLIVPRDASAAAELGGLEALLNSRLVTWFFRAVQPRVGRLFAELKIKHLSAFPLPSGCLTPLASLRGGALDDGVARLFGLSATERGMIDQVVAPH